MINYILRNCLNQNIDLENLLQPEDKGLIDNFFTTGETWATAVLDQINNKKPYDKFLKESNIVLDLGAHIGLFSIYAAPICKKIYAIEPTFEHIKLLTKLTCQHYKNIVPKFCAVSDKTEQREFFCSVVNNTQNSLLRHGEVRSLGLIQCYSLIDFMNNNEIDKVDFVKMDIEGCEMKVIMDKGFKDAIDRIKVLFVEVHNTGIEPNNNFATNYDLIYNKLLSLNLKVQKQDDAIIVEH